MPQFRSKLLIHLVFSTKRREPMLPHEPFTALHAYAQGILQIQKCHLIEMNNVADHVHALFDLHRTEALSNVVMHMKKGTSRWLKEQSPNFAHFDWQEGYGAFSIGRSQRDDVIAYIKNQQHRHPRDSFEDEFRKLLDLRRVWECPVCKRRERCQPRPVFAFFIKRPTREIAGIFELVAK